MGKIKAVPHDWWDKILVNAKIDFCLACARTSCDLTEFQW